MQLCSKNNSSTGKLDTEIREIAFPPERAEVYSIPTPKIKKKGGGGHKRTASTASREGEKHFMNAL